ncbi:cation diffusion facilitator family transporter [Thiocapsa marina]|uniref:Cation-efflux pump FieF n=1 Tax=Thiocapsa marina 5811 TaxID=768671 RepID=F9UCM9_9GAMM|nr:cation diffusion facilitator family transporter [Thiocapsa marina]EGV18142.1 cation diffusion facilitator family transporter [Thiocapsa marina 5811]
MAQIKSPPDRSTIANDRLLRLATYASVATACLLILAKLGAWLVTGSVSVLASLVDSLMDAGASLVNLLAVHWSLMPPDAEHRFGHGKAEALAALGQATLIAGSAVFLGVQAVDRLLHPQPVAEAGVGLLVIGFAILVTLALLAFQRHVIRRTESAAIRADALHYATDLATNAATVVALLLAAAGWSGFDPLFGLTIGAYILYSALRIGFDAVQLLMDRELPEAARGQILDLAASVPGVLGVHGLRTRRSGQSLIIQLHLALEDTMPLIAAHQVALDVEACIRTLYPDSDITIHQDPVSLGEEGLPG